MTRNYRKIAGRALFPHPAFVFLLAFAAAAMLIYSFSALDSADPVSIASYVLSFYALVLVCVRLPAIARFLMRFRRENPYAARYVSDVRLQVNISLSGALILNAAYALFQLGLGFWHRSVWFYAMAGYYFLLALMRLFLVRYTGSHAPGEQRRTEWKKYRFCGICLTLMTFVLTIFMIYFMRRIRVFRHHEITTISMAAYTFTALGLAIRNVLRYRRYGSPVYSAAKAISLVSALVSMLTLENAMFTAFGNDTEETVRRIMLGTTGAVVVLMVQGIAIYMIIHAGRKLKA